MKKNITLVLALLTSSFIFSQDKVKGNGVNTLIETKLNSFKKIILNNDFEVTLIKAENASTEIETDENLHEEIEVEVIDSILTIETSTKLRPKNKLEITIFCTNDLNEIELNDESSIGSLSTVNLDDLLLTINDKSKASLLVKTEKTFRLVNKNKSKMQSKSKLEVDSPYSTLILAESAKTSLIMKTDTLNLTLKRSATLEISGESVYATILNQNNSKLDAKKFKTNDVKLVAKDNVSSEVYAIDNIQIEASDKSETDLYGNPKISLNKFTNFAKISKKEEKKK